MRSLAFSSRTARRSERVTVRRFNRRPRTRRPERPEQRQRKSRAGEGLGYSCQKWSDRDRAKRIKIRLFRRENTPPKAAEKIAKGFTREAAERTLKFQGNEFGAVRLGTAEPLGSESVAPLGSDP